MRKLKLTAFALTLAVTSSNILAQSTDGTNFPWRATSTTPSQLDHSTSAARPTPAQPQRNATLPTLNANLLPQDISSPAEIGFSNIRLAVRQDADLIDDQPSVSDQLLPAEPITPPAPQPATPQSMLEPADVTAAKTLAAPTSPSDALKNEIPAAPKSNEPYSAQPPLSVADTSTSSPANDSNRDVVNSRCNPECQRKLFGRNCNGLEIGGWTQVGYHSQSNILFNDRDSRVNLHQQWLYFDKQAGVTSDWGFRADALYGIDAQNTQAFGNSPVGAPSGWDNGWDNGAYGFALPQLYVQYDNSLWDVKIGKFFSPFGYEVVAAPQNFFYSHSYTMNFTEPFTMTGVLGERQITDERSMILGVTTGWDTGFDRADGGFNLITGTRWQVTDDVNLALTSSIGDTGVRDSGTMSSAVASVKLTESVDYVLQADVLNLRTNNEFGIVQYLFHEINPCLSVGSRLEWWKSDQLFADTRSTYQFTMGANYRQNANLIVRPELRFDWGAAAVDPGAAIFGIDAILTY